ncbi:MAG: hypothetical protein E7D74_07710 [Peptococcus niger]|nr:hypothetical protein [Peptococcus niger]
MILQNAVAIISLNPLTAVSFLQGKARATNHPSGRRQVQARPLFQGGQTAQGVVNLPVFPAKYDP